MYLEFDFSNTLNKTCAGKREGIKINHLKIPCKCRGDNCKKAVIG